MTAAAIVRVSVKQQRSVVVGNLRQVGAYYFLVSEKV